jgi:3-dehydroquinate synthase
MSSTQQKPAPDESPDDVIVQRISVPFEYPVVFTDQAFAPGNRALLDVTRRREPDRRHRVLVVVDDGVAAAWPELAVDVPAYFEAHADALELAGDPIRVPGGEDAKNDPRLVERLHAVIHGQRLDRHAFVLIVGGGGVLDAVGYAAATAHRGIRTIRMPTTVLGQNDSGVGVKNGINAFGAKNFLGTFVPPFAVVNDLRFIERLPPRERTAGVAEAVKVALIRDEAFFSWLEAHASAVVGGERPEMATMIRRCAELHMRHIATGGDPFEHGSARPLDFGHWAAHKLEALTRHELRHGEAVAIGLLLDSRYSVEAGLLGETEFARIHQLLSALGLPRWSEALRTTDASGRLAVLGGLDEFREHLGGELTVTLLEGIGRSRDVNEMDEALIHRALAWIAGQERLP